VLLKVIWKVDEVRKTLRKGSRWAYLFTSTKSFEMNSLDRSNQIAGLKERSHASKRKT
jgi:hypothetical protein